MDLIAIVFSTVVAATPTPAPTAEQMMQQYRQMQQINADKEQERKECYTKVKNCIYKNTADCVKTRDRCVPIILNKGK